MPAEEGQGSPSVSVRDAAARALALRLRDARTGMNLTLRELAQASGIPQATLSALEHGRDPRWSTLMRYLDVVPGLRADELLPPAEPCPPAALPAVHAFFVRASGLHAARVRVTCIGGAEDVLVEDLRLLEPSANRALDESRLLQAACLASHARRRMLAEPRNERTITFEEEGASHELVLGPPDEPPRVTYRRRRSCEPCGAGVRFDIRFPAGELLLALDAPGPGRRGRVQAWATPRATADEPDIAAALHPTGIPIGRTDEGIEARIAPAIPLLTYALTAADDADAAPVPGDGTRPSSFAVIALRARERSGMSMRDLAERMGISHSTIAECERRRDPRASTLRRYLAAVPGLRPQDLLPSSGGPKAAALERAWDWQRALCGAEAEEMRRLHVISDAGDSHLLDTTTGLRVTAARPGDVRLSVRRIGGLYRWAASAARAFDAEGAGAQDGVRTRVLQQDEGAIHREVVIPPSLAEEGLTLREESRAPGMFSVTHEQLLARHGRLETAVSGTLVQHAVPVRRLSVEVRLPASYPLGRAWGVVVPPVLIPDAAPNGSLERLHGSGARFGADAAARVLRLEVDRPPCGLKYGIMWELVP